MTDGSFQRLHMNIDMRALAEAATQLMFYVRGMLMRSHQTDVARHSEVHLYGNVVADMPGAEIVDVADTRFSIGNGNNLVFHFLRQTLLEQFSKRAAD